MESLLSLSFDNISSRDPSKIRKGIKQIEGLLAQICLSKGSSRSPHKRKSSVLSDRQQEAQGSPKQLGDLRHDPAFREFFRLQEGFQWNVTSRLITTLETLLGLGPTTQPAVADALIHATLTLLQGTLLLHPASRTLFTPQTTMNLLLDLLDAASPPRIQAQTLLVLVAVLLHHPANARSFEAADGLATVTGLFRRRAASREVKVRALEFVYFYLLPEEGPSAAAAGLRSRATAPTSARPAGGDVLDVLVHARTHSGESGGAATAMDVDGEVDLLGLVKSPDEKQKLLARYLPNAADIAQDLQNSSPFGIMAAAAAA